MDFEKSRLSATALGPWFKVYKEQANIQCLPCRARKLNVIVLCLNNKPGLVFDVIQIEYRCFSRYDEGET